MTQQQNPAGKHNLNMIAPHSDLRMKGSEQIRDYHILLQQGQS